MLALVATLAALAALGRIAFAPLPNVKPTTDIVLIAGYVLGGAPGLHGRRGGGAGVEPVLRPGPVDAVADGRLGRRRGAAARCWRALTARRLGRVPLALACGAGRPRLRRGHEPAPVGDLLRRPHRRPSSAATFATSLPFDLAHAVGNVAFCLAVRPGAGARAAALPRADGGHVAPGARPPRRRRSSLVALVMASVRGAPARADAERRRGGREGLAALPAPPPRTTTAAGAARPASARPSSTRAGPRSASPRRGATRSTPAARARSLTPAPTPATCSDLGRASRTILVLRAAGPAGARVGGRDLVADLLAKRRPNGSFAGRVNTTAFAAHGAARRRALAVARRRCGRPGAGSPPRPTATAASTSPAAAARRGSTTPARRSRGSSPRAARGTQTVRRAVALPRRAARTPTAASR